MNQKLLRRLERLEAKLAQPSNPHIIKIDYVEITGEVVETLEVEGDPVIRNRRTLGRNRGDWPAMRTRPC